jgi:hypothetical protein
LAKTPDLSAVPDISEMVLAVKAILTAFSVYAVAVCSCSAKTKCIGKLAAM